MKPIFFNILYAKDDNDISKLCIHTITTKPWNIEEAARHFSAAGVAITVWRDALEVRNIKPCQLLLDLI
jgi:hypothetical protein